MIEKEFANCVRRQRRSTTRRAARLRLVYSNSCNYAARRDYIRRAVGEISIKTCVLALGAAVVVPAERPFIIMDGMPCREVGRFAGIDAAPPVSEIIVDARRHCPRACY